MVSRDCTPKTWNHSIVIHTTKLETPYYPCVDTIQYMTIISIQLTLCINSKIITWEGPSSHASEESQKTTLFYFHNVRTRLLKTLYREQFIRKGHFWQANSDSVRSGLTLLPSSSVVSLSHLASTVGLGSIPTKLALFLAVFPNLSNIVLEMVVAANSGRSEPIKNLCYASNSLPLWVSGRLNSADGEC